MEFQHPWLFLTFVSLPLIFLGWWWFQRRRKKAMELYGGSLAVQLTRDYSTQRQVLRFVLFFLGFAMILLALTNPRIGTRLKKQKKEGKDIIVCLDISNSMLAEDVKPSRLGCSKMAIAKLIDGLDEDQIGLVVFAGSAQVQFPLTPDYGGAKMYLNGVNTGMVSTQGTALGAAIDLANQSFNHRSPSKKVIILISDGENHEDDALVAAEKAAGEGIRIFTIGLGSEKGAPIPMGNGKQGPEFKTDEHGETVITKLDEATLKKIAKVGDGIYIRGSGNDTGLDQVMDELDRIEKREYEAVSFSDYENLYPYLIGLGLLLITLEFLIFERKTRLTRNIHLFSKPASTYIIHKKK